MELTSLDIYYLVNELRKLRNAKILKIFQLSKKEFLIEFHSKEYKKLLLRIALPSLLFLAEQKGQTPDNPSGFAMFLRKHLSSAFVIDVNQYKSERIVEFTIKRRDDEFKLIVELFSKGNIILVKDTILGCLEVQEWKDRTIKPRIKYQYPPEQFDYLHVDLEQFTQSALNIQKDSLVKVFASLGMGGKTAELLLDSDEISKKNISKGYEKLQELLKEEKSISANIDKTFNSVYEERAITKENTKLTKKEKIVTSQQLQLEKFSSSIEENKKKGELIYMHYDKIKEVLERVKKHDWDNIKKELKSNPIVKKIDDKKGKIIFSLE